MTLTTFDSAAAAKVNDPVLRNLILGYSQPGSIADYVCPRIEVPARSGKIIRFTKDNFAISDTRRLPGTPIKRVRSGYVNDTYHLVQHALGGEVTFEEAEEALNQLTNLDLRLRAVRRATEALGNSWEKEVIDLITNPDNYESDCQAVLNGSAKFTHPDSDPVAQILEWAEEILNQIGVYPNCAVSDSATFKALRTHPKLRAQVTPTSDKTLTAAKIAELLGLDGGYKIAQKRQLGSNDQLEPMMPLGTMVLFYSPLIGTEGFGTGSVFEVLDAADKAQAAFAYTYTLQGHPIVSPERQDPNTRSYITEVTSEQQAAIVGMGSNGKAGAGFLASSVV